MALTMVEISPCGFCGTGNCEKCCIGVKHEGKHERYPEGVVWVCGCLKCPTGRRRCANCKNRNTDEVNPDTWTCMDIEACQAAIAERRKNNPFTAQLREIKEKATMAKITETKTKAEKVEKAKEPTFCLVTGEPTKGGLFKPGMDARYVANHVETVAKAGFTKKAEADARSEMVKAGVSDKLVAKFEKSVGLAREKAEKAKAEKAEKAAKKAEKKA